MGAFQNIKHHILALLILSGFSSTAFAQSVDIEMPSEGYVGIPLPLRIAVQNASTHSEPVIPAIDGLEIESEGTSRVSNQLSTIIINGQVVQDTSQSSVIYSYQVMPTRAGHFTIPALEVEVDGKVQKTLPQSFEVIQPENEGLLTLEVNTEGPTGYVGQAVDVVLVMDIKAFHDDRYDYTLDEAQTWQLVRAQLSEWGIFEETLTEMAQQRERPQGRLVYKKNNQGEREQYYRYEISTEFWPKRPGQLDVGQVRVVAGYPTGLTQARGFFARPGELQYTGFRPVVASASVEPVQIKPIPENNRPPYFTGSVGNYTMKAEAQPTTMHVGDPIRLSLLVSGDGQMDFLHAPPLWEIKTLTKDFHVPDEPIPGFVRGENKLFNVTIRPKRERVTQIPALPFSFFNPNTGEFKTVYTEPIPIQVKPVERLSLDEIVSKQQPNTAGKSDRSTDSENQTPDISEQIFHTSNTSENFLLNSGHPLASWIIWTALLAPPLVVLGLVGGRAITKAASGSTRVQRHQSRQTALHRIEQAADPGEVHQALTHYVAARCDSSAHRLTRHEAIETLQSAQMSPTQIVVVDECLARCEQLQFSGAGDADMTSLKTMGREAVDALHFGEPQTSAQEAQR